MKYYIMTLVSFVVVLGIKSYTINAQQAPVDDVDVELMASSQLLTQADTIRHQKMIKRFVVGLEKSEVLYGKFTGPANIPNTVFQDYERIQRVGTKEELNRLMNHDSPIVRLYAQKALLNNNMKMNRTAVEYLVNDTTTVMYHNGLNIKIETVGNIASEQLFAVANEF